MTSPIETLLFDLKHHKSFITLLTDLSDPYTQSMHTFQTFTNAIIRSLEASEPTVLALAKDQTLHHLYTGFPSFYRQPEFKEWVEDGTMKDAQRRTEKQEQYLHIVELQSLQHPHMNVIDIVTSAICVAEDWKNRAYDPVNLVKDPGLLSFFTINSSRSLKTLSFSSSSNNNINDENTVQHGDECSICTNTYNTHQRPPKSAMQPHLLHALSAVLAPHMYPHIHVSALSRVFDVW
jgi:hypothetical protein